MTSFGFFEEISQEASITMAVLIITQMITSIAAIFYIKKVLKVSAHFKRVLYSEATFLLTASMAMAIGYSLIVFGKFKNSVSCGLLIDAIPLTVMFNSFLAMSLAALRYFLAKRTEESKNMNDETIKVNFFTGKTI